MKNVACLAAIRDRRQILLVQKGLVWIFPGGKPEGAETDSQCLQREITQEELPGTTIVIDRYFDEIKGMTPHSHEAAIAHVYLGSIHGDEPFKVGGEIKDAIWFDRALLAPSEIADRIKYRLSDITENIIHLLYNAGYLE